MAETLIMDATNDGAHRSPFFNPFKDLDTPAPGEILCPIPANLDAEQIAFWKWFPSKVTPLGELRRKIGLTRREWYYPPDNLRYHKLANLSDHLQKGTGTRQSIAGRRRGISGIRGSLALARRMIVDSRKFLLTQ